MAKKESSKNKTRAKQHNRQRSKKETTNKTMKIVIIASASVAILCIAVIMLTAFDIIRFPSMGDGKLSYGLSKEKRDAGNTYVNPNEADKPDYVDPADSMSDDEIMSEAENLLKPVNADDHFNEIGTVIEKTNVNSSDKVLSEYDVGKNMDDRGFRDYEIMSQYNMEGSFSQEEEIGSSSYESHPVYYLDYIDESNRQWRIYNTNGAVSAYLISYRVENPDKPPVILSESDSLMGYDSHTNTYYEYKPNSDTANVIKISKITAEALEAFSI